MAFFVDWEMVNRDTHSEPTSNLYEAEKQQDAKHDAVIYAKVVDVLADYLKDHKSRAVRLLRKHRVKVGDTDQEVVNAVVEMLYIGDKSFKDDLVSDMTATGVLDGEKNEEKASFLPIIAAAISVVGSGLALAGKSKEAKAQKDAMKAEIIRAIADKKRAEMEAKSKEKNMITMIIGLAALVLVIAIILIYLKKQKEGKVTG